MEKPIFKKKRHLLTPRRVMWLSGSILLVFVMLLILLPLAGQWGIEHWLRNHGAKQATIDDIDFNPFTGRFVLRGLRAGTSEGIQFQVGSVSADMDWWPLVHRRVFIRQIQLNGADIDVSNSPDGSWMLGEVLIQASPINQADQAAASSQNASMEPWGIGVQSVQVQTSRIAYHDAKLNSEVDIMKFALSHAVSWQADMPTDIDAVLKIDGSDFSFTGKAMPFVQQPSVSGAVNLQSLDVKPYGGLINDTALKKLQGKLSLDMKIDAVIQSPEQKSIVTKGGLVVKGVEIERGDFRIQQQQLTWNGSAKVQLSAIAEQPILSVNGRLDADESRVDLTDKGLRINQKSLNWSGEASYAAAQSRQSPQQPSQRPSTMDLTMVADSVLNGLQVTDTNNDLTLAEIDNLELKSIRAETMNKVSLDRLVVKNSKLLQDTPQSTETEQRLGTLAELNADNISITELNDVHIESLRLAGLGANIIRESDGQWRWIKQVLGSSRPLNKEVGKRPAVVELNNEPETTADEQGEAVTKPLVLSIAQLDIDDDSWVKYTDDTVQPAYSTLVKPLHVSLKDLNSADPAQASSLVLQAKLGEYTSISASGKVLPFTTKPTADLLIKVSAFDVPQVSAYMPAYDIQRGRLYATVVFKMAQGKLDVQSNLRLSKLKMIAKSQAEAGLVEQGLAMPLDSALNLLRDNKDQIVLQIPVSGNIEQPEFDLQDIINKATAKALQKAALAYVKQALQPLGTILLVADVAGKLAKPRFKPLSFDPGESKLNRHATEYLDKIAGLLKDRPRLNLTFCGVATMSDKNRLLQRALKAAQSKLQDKSQKTQETKPAPNSKSSSTHTVQRPQVTTEELLTLAQQRGDAMKKYLTEQKNIQAERLYACKPSVSGDEKASPRVEISL